MKYLRLTARPVPDVAPAAFRLVASSRHVDEARLCALSLADSRGATGLFVLDGDRTAFERELREVPEVVAADVADAGDGRFYLLATLGGDAAPLARTAFETLARDGLVVVPPVVYRDGAVHARLVGEAAAVGAVPDALPEGIEVDVREVGDGGATPGDPATALSDRQREAILVALDLGYYDGAERVTHEDVAAELGCAASTASEHLRKAEAKLVRAAMT